MQLDKSTDCTNMVQLLTFLRNLDENSVKAKFISSETLSSRTTAKDIFEKLDLFMKSHDIDWKKLIGVYSDDPRAMTGNHGLSLQKMRS